jgi:hypothetical protein
MKKSRFVLFVLAGALALAPGLTARAGESPASEARVVGAAGVTTDHAAVAGHLRMKAVEARAEAERHRAFARAFFAGGRGAAPGSPIRQRHRRLAEELEAMAAGYEEMARMHDEAAARAN